MASNNYTLLCVILNEPPKRPSVFSVIIPVANNVIDLKDAIKKKKEHELGWYDSDSLVLWKPNVNFLVGSVKDLAERINRLGELSQFATVLDEPTKRMSLCFDHQPPDDNVHIIVEKPVLERSAEGQFVAPLKRPISPSTSQPGPPLKRRELEHPIAGDGPSRSHTERIDNSLDYNTARDQVFAIHEAIKNHEVKFTFSDPSHFQWLPFPSSLPMPSQRFERDDSRGLPSFLYMGRHKFQELCKHAEGDDFLIGNQKLYLYGVSGSGKSHILAALAFHLIRQGKRVAYIPDCRELLTKPAKVLRIVLLNAFPDEADAIRSCPDHDCLLNFWALRERHYLLVDQVNALEEDSGIDGNQEFKAKKEMLRNWLAEMKFAHHYIYSASANEISSREANLKQASITVIPFEGGMDQDETNHWLSYHSHRIPVLTEKERKLVEFYTGRIPLFLHSLFAFQGRKFDESQFLMTGDLGNVDLQVSSFFEEKVLEIDTDQGLRKQYFDTMTGCVQEARVPRNNKKLYDKRFFYIDDRMVGHCTCGAALISMTLLLRRSQFDDFDSQSWFTTVSKSLGNPVVQGYLAEHICLKRIARNGLKVLHSDLGNMPCHTFDSEPNWDNLLRSNKTLCLYTPQPYNYRAIDGVILHLNHKNKKAKLFLIQMTISMHQKDSEEDFFSTIWPAWIKPIRNVGFSIATTFVWIDKQQPHEQIKEPQTRTTRSGTKVLRPEYTSTHVGIEQVDEQLARSLNISC